MIRTLAKALHALIERDGARADNLLTQRFKASEASVIDGTWNWTRHQDLISEEGVGLSAGPLERGPAEHACTSAFPQTERCILMVKHGHLVRNSIVDDIKQLHTFLAYPTKTLIKFTFWKFV